MAIQTQWDSPDKIAVRLIFDTDWMLNDLQQAIHETDQLIASVVHQVDVIIDIQNGMSIPKDFMSIAKELLENPTPRPNEGERVVVGANRTIQFLYNTVYNTFSQQIGSRRLLFESDMESARQTLDELRINGNGSGS